ncbi:MAG: SDR family NAD(P)-dependent oxidoreductase [Candidatus Nitrosocosmicus sp.]|nr:SDR family NAD(P)-dependent oxidoreductase [Candidatus Nitrosocosmicus sp.]
MHGYYVSFHPTDEKNDYGRIVNISSGAASLQLYEVNTRPCISKVALNALTRKLASELGQKNVLVNSIDPMVATDLGGRGGRPAEKGVDRQAATLPNNDRVGLFMTGEPVLVMILMKDSFITSCSPIYYSDN